MPNTPGIQLTSHNRKQLVDAREAAGWTQYGLACLVKVTIGTICRIETGAADPSLATLEAICATLGLSVDVNTTVKITRKRT